MVSNQLNLKFVLKYWLCKPLFIHDGFNCGSKCTGMILLFSRFQYKANESVFQYWKDNQNITLLECIVMTVVWCWFRKCPKNSKIESNSEHRVTMASTYRFIKQTSHKRNKNQRFIRNCSQFYYAKFNDVGFWNIMQKLIIYFKSLKHFGFSSLMWR